jgi:hypothetical protein
MAAAIAGYSTTYLRLAGVNLMGVSEIFEGNTKQRESTRLRIIAIPYLSMHDSMLAEYNDLAWRRDHERGHHGARAFAARLHAKGKARVSIYKARAGFRRAIDAV